MAGTNALSADTSMMRPKRGPGGESLPKDWACPGCGAGKNLFNLLDNATASASQNVLAVADPSMPSAPVAKNTAIEPTLELIHSLARDGLDKTGHHGPMGAMGVPRPTLPQWDDIQILPAQLATKPLAEDVEVGTELVIGPNAKKPLRLKIPIFVSDMSFGALSEEAKTALAKGAEMAGTGIASGEGGMLPEENAANSRYLFELGSAKFGYTEDLLPRIRAFHFKAGQAAKTGTGGHLPGSKVKGKIAAIRGLPEGQPAVSPPTFTDLTTPDDFRRFADRVREVTGGIPIGMKMSAQHIEAGHRLRPASGRGLHHSRRTWRCNWGRTPDLPRQHLRADDPGLGTGSSLLGSAEAEPTSRSSSPEGCERLLTSSRHCAWEPMESPLPTPHSRRLAALRHGFATRTTAHRASPPRKKNFGHGSTLTSLPLDWPASWGPRLN